MKRELEKTMNAVCKTAIELHDASAFRWESHLWSKEDWKDLHDTIRRFRARVKARAKAARPKKKTR